MKKQFATLCLATLTTCCFAQQNLFGEQPPLSPEVHSDHSVTFRLMAPKAESVQITGRSGQCICNSRHRQHHKHLPYWGRPRRPLQGKQGASRHCFKGLV